MKESRKKIVVVLGMHRSGTSAIARGLSVLGVELGNDLHPPGDDNPKGFWEDKNCLRINESLLQHLGSAYDKLGLSPEVLESLNHASVIRSLKLEAVEVLRAKFSQSDQCGFKDPRVSRLLPFWKNVFEEAGCAPGFVIAVRNPISVARSLGKRNGIEPEKSYFLWLEHVVSAVIESIGSRRVVVDYDVFMDNPKEELRRIADMLNLNPPMKNSAALKEFTEEFLEGKLRHTRFQREDLKLDPKLPEDVSRAYELALNLANGKQSFEDVGVQEEFLHIRQRWRDYAPAFGYANILEGKIVDLYHCIAERKEKLENLTKTLTKQQGHTEDLNRRLFQLTEQRGYLQSRYETEQEKVRQLGRQIDESRAQAVAEQEKARQLGRQLDESRAQAVAEQEKARQLGRQLDESRAQAVAEQEKARQLGRQLDESRAQAVAEQEKARQMGRQLDESRAQAAAGQETRSGSWAASSMRAVHRRWSSRKKPGRWAASSMRAAHRRRPGRTSRPAAGQ